MGNSFKYGSRIYEATKEIFLRFGDGLFSVSDIKSAGLPITEGMVRKMKNSQIIHLVGKKASLGHTGIYRLNGKYIAYLLADMAADEILSKNSLKQAEGVMDVPCSQ